MTLRFRFLIEPLLKLRPLNITNVSANLKNRSRVI